MFDKHKEFIKLATAAFHLHLNINKEIKKHFPRLKDVIKTNDDFNELAQANHLIAMEFIAIDSAFIASLYKTSDEFTGLADAEFYVAKHLIEAQPEYISRLYKNLSDFSLLDDHAAKTLAQNASAQIMNLFKTINDYVNYHKDAPGKEHVRKALVEKQGADIVNLIKNVDDFILLASKHHKNILMMNQDNAVSNTAIELIDKNAKALMSLFKSDNEFIRLFKCNKYAAIKLEKAEPELVKNLFSDNAKYDYFKNECEKAITAYHNRMFKKDASATQGSVVKVVEENKEIVAAPSPK